MSNTLDTHLSDSAEQRIADGVPTMEDCQRAVNKRPNMPMAMLERFRNGVPTMADCQAFLNSAPREWGSPHGEATNRPEVRQRQPETHFRNGWRKMASHEPGAGMWNRIMGDDD